MKKSSSKVEVSADNLAVLAGELDKMVAKFMD
jgi:hypothetical protein